MKQFTQVIRKYDIENIKSTHCELIFSEIEQLIEKYN